MRLITGIGALLNNQYDPTPKLQYTPFYDVNNLTINDIEGVYGQKLIWTIGCRLGKITNYYEISPSLLSYKLENYKTGEEIPIELQFIDRETMNIKVSQITTIFKNQLYKLTITYDETETRYYYYMYDQNIVLTTGQQITSNFSGDSDYSIQNQTNDIIEQDKEHFEFWKEMYNNLFVIDSGDTREIIQGIIENTKLKDIGMLSGEEMIIESLNGEPSDFVISWGTTEYQGQTIIPSGEINFTQRINQVPEFRKALNWIRILMGFAIITIMITDIWFTLLKMLGVATSIYDDASEESERLNGITSEYTTVNEDTGTVTRRIVRKRKL